MLIQHQYVSAICFNANSIVTVVTQINVMDGESLIAQSSRQHLVVPGQDPSGEDPVVQAVCQIVHTPEVVAAYQASLPPVTPEVPAENPNV